MAPNWNKLLWSSVFCLLFISSSSLSLCSLSAASFNFASSCLLDSASCYWIIWSNWLNFSLMFVTEASNWLNFSLMFITAYLTTFVSLVVSVLCTALACCSKMVSSVIVLSSLSSGLFPKMDLADSWYSLLKIASASSGLWSLTKALRSSYQVSE